MLQVVTMGVRFLKKNGVISTFYRSCNFIDNKVKYNRLCKNNEISPETEEKQRNHKFRKTPKISILVPLYKTPEVFLREMIESVTSQTYENWQLCLADGTSKESNVTKVVKEYQKKYPERIIYRILESNDGISENTNRALEMADGEYVALLDHDDVLTKDALYNLIKVINAHHDADTIYTDEDKMDREGKNFFNPRFKPDLNIDYLRTNNYICHLFCTRRDIANAIGGFNSAYDGSQDYDFVLRSIENSRGVYHIPKVLYHWRYHENSTAARPESKMYAYNAGQRAIEAHLKRQGMEAEVTMPEYGYYLAEYAVNKSTDIMVILHNINHPDSEFSEDKMKKASSKCIDAYISKLTHATFQKTADGIYCGKCGRADIKLHVKTADTLDYDTVNSFIKNSDDEYVLLADTRVKQISYHTFKELLGFCEREDIMAAAAKASDRHSRVYHCGIIIGLDNVYGYSHRGAPVKYKAYYGRTTMPQNVSAVDTTFTLARKEMFDMYREYQEDEKLSQKEKSGKESENILTDAQKKNADVYQDIFTDMCIRANVCNGQKRHIVVVPQAEVDIDADAKKEIKTFMKKNHSWFKSCNKEFIKNGDPYYSIHLSRKSNLYKIAKH